MQHDHFLSWIEFFVNGFAVLFSCLVSIFLFLFCCYNYFNYHEVDISLPKFKHYRDKIYFEGSDKKYYGKKYYIDTRLPIFNKYIYMISNNKLATIIYYIDIIGNRYILDIMPLKTRSTDITIKNIAKIESCYKIITNEYIYVGNEEIMLFCDSYIIDKLITFESQNKIIHDPNVIKKILIGKKFHIDYIFNDDIWFKITNVHVLNM